MQDGNQLEHAGLEAREAQWQRYVAEQRVSDEAFILSMKQQQPVLDAFVEAMQKLGVDFASLGKIALANAQRRHEEAVNWKPEQVDQGLEENK